MAPRDKYTDPKLRDEVKEEIHKSDKGGEPGQWSARKAQMMAAEYKKRGGSYNTSKGQGQSETQKHLDQWTKEDWQTKEGSGTAKTANGTRKRYLPKKAWEEMGDDEKEETETKKVKESKQGKQFVGNTPKAKSARKDASRKAGDSHDDSHQASEDDTETKKPQTRTQTRSSDKKNTTDENEVSKQHAGENCSAAQSKKPNKKSKNQQEEGLKEDGEKEENNKEKDD